MKLVGIIILNYNNWEDTIQCIESVLKIDYLNYNVYIVDNQSANDSYDKLSQYVQDFKSNQKNQNILQSPVNISLTLSPRNGGYAAGNNVGIKQALSDNCEYILILNNDSIVSTDFLNILVNFAEDNQVYLCGPKIIESGTGYEYGARRMYNGSDYFFVPPNIIWHFFKNNSRWKYLQFENQGPFIVPFEIDVLSGSCMLINKDYFIKSGLLDENTFLYMEELIISHKASTLGFKTFCVPQAVIVHEGGSSTSTVKKSIVVKHFIDACKYFMRRYQQYSILKTYFLLSGFYVFYWALKLKLAAKSMFRS